MIDFKSKIDTIQCITSIDNIEDVNVIRHNYYAWCKDKGMNSDGEIIFMLHISEYNGACDVADYSFKEQMKMKSKMLKELGIMNQFEVRVNRVDVCFDSKVMFQDMYKLNDCLSHLYAMNYKTTNVFDNINKTCFEVENMKVLSKHNELEIYDKFKQRKGQHEFNTRIEFRFKNIRVDEKTKVKDLISLLDRMMVNYDVFEEKRANALYLKYLRDLDKGKVKNFTQFVNANKDYITSSKVCQYLYEKTGMSGAYKKWMYKYKQSNEIEFVTKTEMKQMISDMKKCIKAYIKA